MLQRLPILCSSSDLFPVLCAYWWRAVVLMELLGGEFGDMTPQELAAPVNTVAVSLRTVGEMGFHHEHQDCVMYWQKEVKLVHIWTRCQSSLDLDWLRLKFTWYSWRKDFSDFFWFIWQEKWKLLPAFLKVNHHNNCINTLFIPWLHP